MMFHNSCFPISGMNISSGVSFQFRTLTERRSKYSWYVFVMVLHDSCSLHGGMYAFYIKQQSLIYFEHLHWNIPCLRTFIFTGQRSKYRLFLSCQYCVFVIALVHSRSLWAPQKSLNVLVVQSSFLKVRMQFSVINVMAGCIANAQVSNIKNSKISLKKQNIYVSFA